jgi:hypothetical protein
MKAKKALKRLNKVEALLSTVIDGYQASNRRLRELLGSAMGAITRAKTTVGLDAHPRVTRKMPAKAQSAQERRLNTEVRGKTSRTAKRTDAKPGLQAANGKRLSKTA